MATPRSNALRLLHPAAWWCWALGVAIAASRTTNPWLLLLLAGLLGWTVAQRREPGTGRILVAFLAMGALAIVLRVSATAVGGARMGAHLLMDLPMVPLPSWLGGLRLGGPVHLEPLLGALYEGAQLAVVLGSVGAANALAGPRRLLRYVPATLYDVGTALVVGLTYAPRLITEAERLARARRLRGHRGRGVRETGLLVVPVISGALDGALGLAASMECRGYGRAIASRRRQLLASGLAMLGLGGIAIGVYGLLDGFTPLAVGLPMVLLGVAVAAATLYVGAGRDPRTCYRRDPFATPERLTVACGVILAAGFAVWAVVDPVGMHPSTIPLVVPDLPLLPVLVLVVGALPGALTPEPPLEPSSAARAARVAVQADDGDLTPHALAPALARGIARRTVGTDGDAGVGDPSAVDVVGGDPRAVPRHGASADPVAHGVAGVRRAGAWARYAR